MAIYHCTTKPISRSAGRSAVAAAAYRAGVELVDERTGQVHDYTRKQGVESATVLLPDGSSADRSELWNAAESAERRKDARTAREWIVALPAELTGEQRQALAHEFGSELARRYGVAVDVAIHQPDREGDQRNHHAHILTTTRQVSRGADGGLELGDKATLEQSDKKRREQGLGASRDEIKGIRARWAELANQALERAGHAERIDHRSYAEQGIDKVATTHLGPVATAMERRGEASDRGDLNRNAEQINRVAGEVIDLQQARQGRDLMRRAEQEPEAVQAEYASTWKKIRQEISSQVNRIQSRIEDMLNSAEKIRDSHIKHAPPPPPKWQFWKQEAYRQQAEQWREKGNRLIGRCQTLEHRHRRLTEYNREATPGTLGSFYRKGADALADQRLERQHPSLAVANKRAAELIRQRELAERQRKQQERAREAEKEWNQAKRRSRSRGRGGYGL